MKVRRDAYAASDDAAGAGVSGGKGQSRPIVTSIGLLALLCLLAISWMGRLNVRTLLTIRSRSSLSSILTASASSDGGGDDPLRLYYPSLSARQAANANASANSALPMLTEDSVRCVVYDRPPRTGSTTVYKYLDRCLAGRGFGSSLRTFKGVHDHNLLDHFVRLDGKNKTLLSRHLTTLPAGSLEAMLKHCTVLLYVTSTRSIRERLLSKLKYELPDAKRPGQIVAERRQKIQLDALKQSMKKRISENMHSLFPSEQYYESFPSISPASATRSLAPRFVPDYVIRPGSFHSDFRALLTALNCSTKFHSANVHTVQDAKHDDQQLFLDAIPVSLGDVRYRALMRLAELNNEAGLKKAALFV